MAKISCRDVGLRLQSYLDDELDPNRMDRIRQHLAACVQCGLEYDVFARLKSDIGSFRVDPDPAAIERLRQFALGISDQADSNLH